MTSKRCFATRATMLAVVLASTVIAASTFAGPAAALPVAPTWHGVPAASDGRTAGLESVSCPSETLCVAVGSAANGDPKNPTSDDTLTESWDGAAWHLVPSPDSAPGGFNELYSVSCVSASSCTAVGSSQRRAGLTVTTLVESWNGSSWHVVPSPNTDPVEDNSLEAVSCVSASACIATGYFVSSSGWPQTLVESWDGATWQIVASPNAAASVGSRLEGVSCVSASACVAVGSAGDGAFDQTLVESWDGSAWHIVTSPSTGQNDNAGLTSVSCVSAAFCVAGGYSSNLHGMIERWDGVTWQVMATPPVLDTSFQVASVSCTSSSSCAAAAESPGVYSTWTMDWDGAGWTLSRQTIGSTSAGVACSGRTCVAVGRTFNPGPFTYSPYSIVLQQRWRVCSGPVPCPNGSFSPNMVHRQLASTPACRANPASGDPTGMVGLPPTIVDAFQVSDSANQETFVVGGDGLVYHNYQTRPGMWVGWSTVGGPPSKIYGGVRTGTNYLGQQELYVRAGDGQVYHLYATPGRGSGWQGWDPMGAPSAGIAGDVYEGTNYLHNQELYVVGNDGNVYHKFSTPGQGTGWSNWDPMGRPDGVTLLGDVHVGVNYLCNQELYVTGTDGNVYHNFSTPGQGSGWSAWSSLGQPSVGTAGEVSNGFNASSNQELYIVGRDGSVYHDFATPGVGSGWSGWTVLVPFGGIVSTSPWVDTYPVQRVSVWTSSAYYTNTASVFGWGGWIQGT